MMADNGETTVVDNEVVDIFNTENGDPLDRSANAGASTDEGTAVAVEPKAAAELPSKFQGKTLDEVVDMYGNLENAYGKQGNELGEIRQLADNILQNQIAANTQTGTPDAIDADALLADPVGVITNIIQSNPAIQEIAGRVVKTEQITSLAALESKHGKLEEIGSNPGFRAWVQANPARLQRFAHADKNHDFATADDLLSTYKEIAEARGEELSNKREEQRKAIATPRAGVGSSAGSPNGKTQRKAVYSRAQLMKLRNTDPARYSRMQPEIIAAYAEKRVVP